MNAPINRPGTSYDAIPYPTVPFPETHPERLCAIARIFGLDAPVPARARVLELGCSMGGNLVAIAQINPGSRCVGVDASSHQIAEGWKTIDALGLKNVQLRHLDIMEIDDGFGEFDYIISHGVYSWVPARVQEKMLEICHRNLAANGVAYISYNTFPGWHIRGVVRDMMFYRGMQFANAEDRLAQAKSLVEFVANVPHSADTPYRRMLQDELKQLGRMSDHYLHHEYLEEHNQPLYFHEFARRLAVSGLQYLGDAEFSTMISTNFSSETARTLNDLGAHDILQMEQYMDFVRCRYFRKTLICHNAVRLNRAIDSGVVGQLLLLSDAEPDPADAPVDPSQRVIYESRGGTLTCRSPQTKLAMAMLRRSWPMPVPFAKLAEESGAEAARLGHPVAGTAALAADLLTAMGAGVVEWRVSPVAYAADPPERPQASALARLQAGQGYRAANLRGEMITLDEIHRQTLRLLDGTHTPADLTEKLVGALKAGEFLLRQDNEDAVIRDESGMRELLGSAMGKILGNLARQAFLRAPDG